MIDYNEPWFEAELVHSPFYDGLYDILPDCVWHSEMAPLPEWAGRMLREGAAIRQEIGTAYLDTRRVALADV